MNERNPHPSKPASTDGTVDGPILLPPTIAHSDDLTWKATQQNRSSPSPYQDPCFQIIFREIARALHRRQSPHAFLVGERGVGKTTIAAEFSRRVLLKDFPYLVDKRVLLVDSRFTPADESRQRLSMILGAVVNQQHLIVVWEGLPGLLLSAPSGANKAVLLGALAFARCRIVGLCTPREYEALTSDDPELEEIFTRVEVPEPSPEASLKLLEHFAEGLGNRYQLAIEQSAVTTAVSLTANYVLNDHLPGKALRVLIQACEDNDFRRDGATAKGPAVTAADVVRAVAVNTGIPEHTLCGVSDDTNYESALGELIFGQEHAVREVATELGLIKAGMTDPGKPASVLMLLGQTGTGKTEIAKALARFYSASKKLKTYTLGNCVEAHSVSTIIGVPPGYVGSERGGRLIADLNADPYAVFLLDEADKAHPDVLQPFLNLFDEGWVTDQRGAKGFANKAIFILTTNVGQRMIADMSREGKTNEEISTRMKEALSQIRHSKSDRPVFTPEFLARIKRVIVFRPLGRDAMVQIARKLLGQIQKDWVERRAKRLELSADLPEYLGSAAHQFDDKSGGKEGGRVVRKLLAEWVEAPLQRAMAADPEAYRNCSEAILECEDLASPPADQTHSQPSVRIRFR